MNITVCMRGRRANCDDDDDNDITGVPLKKLSQKKYSGEKKLKNRKKNAFVGPVVVGA